MDKLQWFKFTPTDWIMGKIQRCPEITQARFMRLICLYWNKECILSYEDAEIEIDKEHLDILIAKKVIKIINDFIFIDFLNEQLKEIDTDKTDKSISAKIGNLKRWHRPIYDRFIRNELDLEKALSIAYQSHPDSDPIAPQSQNIAEESKTIPEKISSKESDIEVIEPVFLEQKEFLELFNKCRKFYDKIETTIDNLKSNEKIEFMQVSKNYNRQYIIDALTGFYQQQNMFPQTRLRPYHFLQNIELYYECFKNKKQLYLKSG